jgi:hypothetical protein
MTLGIRPYAQCQLDVATKAAQGGGKLHAGLSGEMCHGVANSTTSSVDRHTQLGRENY